MRITTPSIILLLAVTILLIAACAPSIQCPGSFKKIGKFCCYDDNDNGVCDTDETVSESPESEQLVETPVPPKPAPEPVAPPPVMITREEPLNVEKLREEQSKQVAGSCLNECATTQDCILKMLGECARCISCAGQKNGSKSDERRCISLCKNNNCFRDPDKCYTPECKTCMTEKKVEKIVS